MAQIKVLRNDLRWWYIEMCVCVSFLYYITLVKKQELEHWVIEVTPKTLKLYKHISPDKTIWSQTPFCDIEPDVKMQKFQNSVDEFTLKYGSCHSDIRKYMTPNKMWRHKCRSFDAPIFQFFPNFRMFFIQFALVHCSNAPRILSMNWFLLCQSIDIDDSFHTSRYWFKC